LGPAGEKKFGLHFAEKETSVEADEIVRKAPGQRKGDGQKFRGGGKGTVQRSLISKVAQPEKKKEKQNVYLKWKGSVHKLQHFQQRGRTRILKNTSAGEKGREDKKTGAHR